VSVGKSCVCGAGKTLENGVCVFCAAGTFKDGVGNEQCRSCNLHAVLGSFSTTSSIALALNATSEVEPPISSYNCSCAQGEYRNLAEHDPELPIDPETHIGMCVSCDKKDGVICSKAGLTLETLVIEKGWWRYDSLSKDVTQCYFESACEQLDENQPSFEKPFNLTRQCRSGHHGPICNVCDAGFVKSVSGECKQCVAEDGDVNVPWQLYALMVTVGVIIFYIVRKQSKHLKNKSAAEQLAHFRRDKVSTLGKIRTKVSERSRAERGGRCEATNPSYQLFSF